MRWIVPCAPIVWLMLTAGASGQDASAFDPIGEVQADFDEIASFLPAPTPTLIVTKDTGADGLTSDGNVTLSNQSISTAHSRQELKGLLAYLAARAAMRPTSVDADNIPALTSILAAGAVIAAGEKIDPIDQRKAPREAWRNYRWSPSPPQKLGGTERGHTALMLMKHVQTCSGAALALMKRLALPKDIISGPPIRFVAQQAIRDFGSLAAPPDISCMEQR